MRISNRLRNRLRPTELESRINPGVVTLTTDYDWTDAAVVPVPGTLRYEVTKAVEAGGGEITFDESIDLGGGAKFGGPIVAANTIQLKYGQILIEDKNENPQPLSKGLLIHAPKFFDEAKQHVAVAWTKSAYLEGDINNFGKDWSVFNIINTRNPLVTMVPERVDPYHALYENVTLGGLQIIMATGAEGVIACMVAGGAAFGQAARAGKSAECHIKKARWSRDGPDLRCLRITRCVWM